MSNNVVIIVADDVPVMVATNAFGMGIDKSNVSYVAHFNMPGSVEAYYQEAGRAGRDGAPAECLLLWCDGDIATGRFFIEQESANEALTPEESEVVRAGRRRMLEAMVGYCYTTDCLRRYLLRYFGEDGEGEEGEEGEKTEAASDVEFTPMLYTYQDLTNARSLVAAYTALMTTEDAGFFVVDDTMTKTAAPSFDGETPPTSGTVQLARNTPEGGLVQSLTLDWSEGTCTVAVELPEGNVKDPAPPPGSSDRTVTQVVESLRELPPSVLGLEGETMDDYRIYTQDGIAWVDDIPCLRMSVYRMEEGGINEIAGHYFLSTDGLHVYKLNVGTNQVVELDIQDALK